MNDGMVSSRVRSSNAIEGRDELRREMQRVAGRARAWVTWHSGRMETDAEYRAAVDHLTKVLAARPSWVGEMTRRLIAGHTALVNVL